MLVFLSRAACSAASLHMFAMSAPTYTTNTTTTTLLLNNPLRTTYRIRDGASFYLVGSRRGALQIQDGLDRIFFADRSFFTPCPGQEEIILRGLGAEDFQFFL